MIFPTGWQEPKNANNLKKLNNKETKEDKQIIFIDNKQNVFPGISGAEWTNVILWKKGCDNELDGKQKVLTNGKDENIIKLITDKSDIVKPDEIVKLSKIVTNSPGFVSLQSCTSTRKPYGLRTDVLDNPKKYNLPQIYDKPQYDDDIAIYGLKNRKFIKCYIEKDYPIPKITSNIQRFTVLIGKAWGNFSSNYIGGAYADIVISKPNEICTENFLESGSFNNFKSAQKHAKYIMTKFCRALVFMNKYSQDNSRDKWISVPVQDYSEEWWEDSIAEIDEHLFEKYNIPENIRDFVRNNVQTRTTDNIVNYTYDALYTKTIR